MPLSKFADQTVHEVLVIDGLRMRASRNERREKGKHEEKSVQQFPKSNEKGKKTGFISKAVFKKIVCS